MIVFPVLSCPPLNSVVDHESKSVRMVFVAFSIMTPNSVIVPNWCDLVQKISS